MLSAVYAKLYWTLLASFCVMGLLLAFAQPLFSVPDEGMHWDAAHYRLEHFFGAEGCVPTLVAKRCLRRGGPCGAIPRRSNTTCLNDPTTYGGVLTYPGVMLSKLVLPRQTESGVRQVQGFLLGRLIQGLLVVVCLVRLGQVALHAQRGGALLLGGFILSPLVAQQAFGISSDSAQIAFGACLFVAIVAWERLAWVDLALFTLFGFCSTAKPTTLPCIVPSLVTGFWFAEQLRDPSSSPWAVLKRLVVSLTPRRAPSVQTCMLWSGLALSLLTVVFSLLLDSRGNVNENASRTANAIALRENPWLVLQLVTRQRYNPFHVKSWVSPLGWLDLDLAPAAINAFVRILVFALLLELAWLGWQVFQERPRTHTLLGRLVRVLPPLVLGLLGPVINVLFVCAVMFVVWSPTGADTPEGVQFRYFFPAAIVTIAVLARAFDALVRRPEDAPTAPRPRSNWMVACGIAAQCLVFGLSLPYVARVYVELSERYHDGGRPRY